MENQLSCDINGTFGQIVNSGVIAQITMGFLSFSTLVSINFQLVKRFKEKRPRPWLIWGMVFNIKKDTSKQGFGSIYLHFLNVIGAVLLNVGVQDNNECKWYFLNFMVDICIGTFLNIILLHIINIAFGKIKWLNFSSGDYGEPPSFVQWAYQLFWWIIILTLVTFI